MGMHFPSGGSAGWCPTDVVFTQPWECSNATGSDPFLWLIFCDVSFVTKSLAQATSLPAPGLSPSVSCSSPPLLRFPPSASPYPPALSELIFLTHLGRLVITVLSRNPFHFITPGEKHRTVGGSMGSVFRFPHHLCIRRDVRAGVVSALDTPREGGQWTQSG